MIDAQSDIYSSRTGSEESIVRRRDPVVYAKRSPGTEAGEKLSRDYERNGYMVLPDVFDTEEVRCFQREALRLCADPLLSRRDEAIVEPNGRAVRSIFNVQQFSTIFRKLAHDTRLVSRARYILGDDVYLHQSRLNYKPGFEGKEFYWHSDFETWHVEDGMPSMRAVSISIALADNLACNGPVMVIPGSHLQYVSCGGRTPENNYKESLRQQNYGVPSRDSLEQLATNCEIAVITGAAGSVLLFDSNTMHGSAGNISPYPRTNLFLVYNAVSNRLQKPFSGQKPRPEFIARRENVEPIVPEIYGVDDYRE
jgi:ectoine hydroxylase